MKTIKMRYSHSWFNTELYKILRQHAGHPFSSYIWLEKWKTMIVWILDVIQHANKHCCCHLYYLDIANEFKLKCCILLFWFKLYPFFVVVDIIQTCTKVPLEAWISSFLSQPNDDYKCELSPTSTPLWIINKKNHLACFLTMVKWKSIW